MNNNCLIIIVVLNQLEYTRGCVESIIKHTNYPYKILIVDNGSNKETIDYLRYLQRQNAAEVIFNKKNLGWVEAVNQGMFYDDSSYVCVMNNDTLVYPGWLSEMVDISRKDKTIGIVNPLWGLPKKFKGSRNDYYDRVVTKHKGEFIAIDWARGFCFLVKRGVINKIGGLDEVFSPGCYDDWDYSVRAWESGFRCVRAKGAFVYHYKNVTYSEEFGREGMNNAFKEKGAIFYERWGRPLRVFIIIDSTYVNLLSSLKDFILYLLKKQNKVFVLNSQGSLLINHTNYIERGSMNAMLGAKAIVKIIGNLRHSQPKRYDTIICSSSLNKFLEKFYFIRNNYIIKELDGNLDNDNREEILTSLSNLKKRGF